MSDDADSKTAPKTPTPIAAGETTIDSLGHAYQPLTWAGQDGLRLAGRAYGERRTDRRPLLCLPGLTRNARDFEALAAHLMPLGVHVIVTESRGRGQSAWDPNPANYHPTVELADVFALVDGLGIDQVDAIGTSRGGLLMMLGATLRPGLFRRSILNDIGPRIELDGLLKIKGYVGRELGGLSWDEATAALARSQQSGFPHLDDAGWTRYGRRLWRDVNGRPENDYDPALALGLERLTEESRLPEPWEGLAALAQHPVLVLHGGLSDLLTRQTVDEMLGRHATIEAYEVPDEAHAPLLEDQPTLDRIARFLEVV